MKNSDLLFHFTPNLKNVQNILKKGFYPHYTGKAVLYRKPKNKKDDDFYTYDTYAQVSFCNIRLSEVNIHSANYGNYGIAISKKYALDLDINPIVYIEKNSEHSLMLKSVLKETANPFFKNENELIERSVYLEQFFKNYYGDDKNGKYDKKFNNVAEHEYLYIPLPILSTERGKYWDYLPKKLSKKGLLKENKRIRKFKLKIKSKHIEYILLNKFSDIKPFINFLKNNFSEKKVYRLIPKIITKEQLQEDF